jgi:hypothetical protein
MDEKARLLPEHIVEGFVGRELLHAVLGLRRRFGASAA